MSLLAPLFLAGLAAIAAPILWHLIRRRPKDTAPFPSLMFLEPTPPRMTKRSRLEDLLLLLLRVFMLALVALAFARPYFGKPAAAPPAGEEHRKIAVLIDVSASMQRSGLWDAALERAGRALRDLNPADLAEVWVFDDSSRRVVGSDQWRNFPAAERASLALDALRKEKPGWKSTWIGRALISAVEQLEALRTTGGGGIDKLQVVLISDFQAGAHLDGLAGHNWPKGLEVKLESIAQGSGGNASLHWLGEPEGLSSQGGAAELKVRVQNHPKSKGQEFRIGWVKPGSTLVAGKPVTVQVPPGQSRTLTPPAKEPGQEVDALHLEGDEAPFDNKLYRVVNEEEVLRILALTDETVTGGSSMLYFLKRALVETARHKVSLSQLQPGEALEPSALTGARALVLMEPASQHAWNAAASFLESGKTVLVALRGTSSAGSLAKLLGVENIALTEASGGDSVLSRLDWEHPILSPFAEARYGDFSRIRFWKHRKIGWPEIPGARAIAWFDQGDAALVEIPVKTGRVLLFTSGWHTEDSQLALSSKFVPLLYRVLEWSGVIVDQPAQFVVGAEIPLGPGRDGELRRWQMPGGMETNLAPATTAMRADVPGIYQLSGQGKTRRFAVNLAPAESRVEPMPADELERLGVPVKMSPLETKMPPGWSPEKRALQEAAVQMESRQKGWRWLLAAAMVLFAVETAMAGWAERKPAVTP